MLISTFEGTSNRWYSFLYKNFASVVNVKAIYISRKESALCTTSDYLPSGAKQRTFKSKAAYTRHLNSVEYVYMYFSRTPIKIVPIPLTAAVKSCRI